MTVASANQSHPDSVAAPLTIQDILQAQEALRGVVQETALTHSSNLSAATGADIYLKCENLQRTGSFKIRGAYNRMLALSNEERKRGVVAASAGNHAQGVALAASLLGIKATVFMPESTPLAKVAATQAYGAAIRLKGLGYDDAYEAALGYQERHGAIFIHPFEDRLVMAGQATVGLEILAQLPSVDAILVPVGGGGLIAGVATAVKAFKPAVEVIGVQASGAASMSASLAAGEPRMLQTATTIADGIAVRRPGIGTLEVVSRLVDRLVVVEEEMISAAIVMLLERAKLVVEGAGAVGLAALLGKRLDLSGRRVAVILSGGNIDINLMARIIEHGLATAGRYLIFETWLPDKPGELLKVLRPLVEQRVNILAVEHRRPASFPDVEVMLTVETRDREHGDRLVEALRERGYRVNRLEFGQRPPDETRPPALLP